MIENELGNPVVENAFTFDHFMLLFVEGGGVVLEKLDEGSRFGPFIENFGLALINSAASAHLEKILCEEEILAVIGPAPNVRPADWAAILTERLIGTG
jgi:hypothetical protein